MAEKPSSKKLAASGAKPSPAPAKAAPAIAPKAAAASAARPAPAPIAKPVAPPAAATPATPAKGKVDAKERQRLVAEAAYYRALKRGFAPGHEVQDWIAAEKEVDARLATR